MSQYNFTQDRNIVKVNFGMYGGTQFAIIIKLFFDDNTIQQIELDISNID